MIDAVLTLPEAMARAADAYRDGRLAEANQLYAAVVRAAPDHVEALINYSAVCLALGRRDQAMSSCAVAVVLQPDLADAHFNRGVAHLSAARTGEAFIAFDRTLAIDPGHVDALGNRAACLRTLGHLEEALVSLRSVSVVLPDHAAVYRDMGSVFREAGDLRRAARHYRRALTLHPQDVLARIELGNSLRLAGAMSAASVCYRQALSLAPDDAGAFGNLGYALLAGGAPASAFSVAMRALTLRFSREIVSLIVKCLEEPIPLSANIQPLILRILAERWERPGTLVAVGLHLFRSSAAMARVVDAPLPVESLKAASGEPVLRTLLTLAPVVGIDLERMLTRLRRHAIEATTDFALSKDDREIVAFVCALARQCFLNEYVFTATDDETTKADRLRLFLIEAMEVGAEVDALRLVVAAAYFPLHTLPGAERLLRQAWPEDVEAVLTQQIREPLAESVEAKSIPRLTPILGEVSQAVRRQYEESPYPRWADTLASRSPVSVDVYLRQAFPGTGFQRATDMERADVLIAGCGTGQQSIETAMTFRHGSVLAVDLSLASLGYAKRKTRELQAPPIAYAQADIMELGGIGRTFDLIESSGVLHHLADPFAGWRMLLSLLRPGGVMRLGFYSDLARRDIIAARAFVAERKYGTTSGDIRAARQELLMLSDRPWARSVVESADFATVSACRDLIFHVQEHRFSLPQIADFIDKEELRFIGFETRLPTQATYMSRFPEDSAMTDLRSWHVFETENPDTFRGMYQFWVQKPQ